MNARDALSERRIQPAFLPACLALCLAFGPISCSRKDPSAPPATTATAASSASDGAPISPARTSHGGAPPGWEDGASTFERSLGKGAPIVLYVSSEWCPPCRAMEVNLLSKRAFLDATKGVLRVRIDGDSEGAQALVEEVEAHGYPTLILFSSEGEELFRAHHAISLEEIAPALAAARASGSGFSAALKALSGGGVSNTDCALFAAASWDALSTMTLSTPERLQLLKKAFAQCKDAPEPTRAGIAAHLLGLAAMADTFADSALPGAEIKPMAKELLDVILRSPESAWAARTLLTTWVRPVVSWVLGADRGPDFAALQSRWLRAASALRNHTGAPQDVVILTYNAGLDFHKLKEGDALPDPQARAEIEAAVAHAEKVAITTADRHTVLPNAAYLLRSIGQKKRAEKMLLVEIARTDAPSYYLTTLSQWALQDGRKDDARMYARKAVTSAQGRASRIQWMVNEIALYAGSSDASDRAVTGERAGVLYAQLFAAKDAFSGRNGARAAQLSGLLEEHKNEPAIKALVEQYEGRCDSLEGKGAARCKEHFASLRAPGR